MSMDSTYMGAYGRLKVSKAEFLSPAFVDQLAQKEADDFLKTLSTTSYRKEIDALSALYAMPDLVEVVLNAHMMRMVKNATFAMPPLARDFVMAYVSKWDIENIKTILSSKTLGYEVHNTETFLTVQRTVPVGIFGGVIGRDEYTKIMEQKDIDGVVNALVKYGYGTTLLKYVDEAKKTHDISQMVLALDIHYFDRIMQSFRFYNGDEGPMLGFIKGLIDIRNIMTVLKGSAFKLKSVKEFFIKGGSIPESKLIEMSSKPIDGMRSDMPFKIDEAFERYKHDPFLANFEVALRRELDRKYLRLFDSLALSLESIMGFVIRSELERYELRSVWMGKYYRISKERADNMRIMRYVVS